MFKLGKGAIISLAIVGVLIVSALSFYGWVNGQYNGAIEREIRVSRAWESQKSDLDAFLTTAREQAGIVKGQSAAFDKIMVDALSARYQGKEGSPTSAQPGSGTLFSAIAEAYPNLDGLNANFTRLLDTISAGRQTFNNDQKKLQDQFREYDTWRSRGLIRGWFLTNIVHVPTTKLVAVTDAGKLTGQAAYDKMSLVITSGVTAEAFKTGKLEAQDFMK